MKIYRRRAEESSRLGESMETRCLSTSGKAPIHKGYPYCRAAIRRYFVIYTNDLIIRNSNLLMFNVQMEEIADLSNLKLI